jgi:hypothetical protein
MLISLAVVPCMKRVSDSRKAKGRDMEAADSG